jgi:hypothetical protein
METIIACFGKEITGAKVIKATIPKSVLVSSPAEDVGFRDNIFL